LTKPHRIQLKNINSTKLLIFYFEESILLGTQTYNITNIQFTFP